jgi:hypothetical protein
MDLRGLARKGFFQRNFHVVAQVGAALAPAGGAAAPAPHHLAEDILEDVGEAARREAVGPVHAAILEGSMAEAVIGGPLLRVLEALISLVDFLELVLAGFVARIAVGMELHGELAERALEFLVVRTAAHAERFVEINLHLKPVLVLLPDGSKSAETAIPVGRCA